MSLVGMYFPRNPVNRRNRFGFNFIGRSGGINGAVFYKKIFVGKSQGHVQVMHRYNSGNGMPLHDKGFIHSSLRLRNPGSCRTCGLTLQLIADSHEDDPELFPRLYLSAHCYLQAMQLVEQNKFDEAVAAFTQSISFNSSFADAYYNRGELRIHLGDLNGALADCNEALRINPKDSDAYINRANIRGQQGDLEGAVSDSSQAIKLGTEKPIVYFNRSLALLQLGRFEDANTDLKRFNSLSPENPRASSLAAMIKLIT